MKTRNLVKQIILILLVFILVFTILPIKSNASALDDVIAGADSFLETGKSSGDVTLSSSEIKDVSDTIYNILLGVGIVIALVVGSVLGIQFMLASAEDKAKVKEALIPYVVGCVIIFGAFGIWKVAVLIGGNF